MNSFSLISTSARKGSKMNRRYSSASIVSIRYILPSPPLPPTKVTQLITVPTVYVINSEINVNDSLIFLPHTFHLNSKKYFDRKIENSLIYYSRPLKTSWPTTSWASTSEQPASRSASSTTTRGRSSTKTSRSNPYFYLVALPWLDHVKTLW